MRKRIAGTFVVGVIVILGASRGYAQGVAPDLALRTDGPSGLGALMETAPTPSMDATLAATVHPSDPTSTDLVSITLRVRPKARLVMLRHFAGG